MYIHTAHTQPTSATHSSTGRLLLETYAVITALMLAGRWPASGSGQPAEPFLHASHSCMLQTAEPCPTGLVSFPDPSHLGKTDFLVQQNGGVLECERANQIAVFKFSDITTRNDHVTA